MSQSRTYASVVIAAPNSSATTSIALGTDPVLGNMQLPPSTGEEVLVTEAMTAVRLAQNRLTEISELRQTDNDHYWSSTYESTSALTLHVSGLAHRVQKLVNAHNYTTLLSDLYTAQRKLTRLRDHSHIIIEMRSAESEIPRAVDRLDSSAPGSWRVIAPWVDFGFKRRVKSWFIRRRDFPELSGIADESGCTYQQTRSYLVVRHQDGSLSAEYTISHLEERTLSDNRKHMLIVSIGTIFKCLMEISTAPDSLTPHVYSAEEHLPVRFERNALPGPTE
jgi:hypothetical protein